MSMIRFISVIINSSLLAFHEASNAGYSAITNPSQLTFNGSAIAGNANKRPLINPIGSGSGCGGLGESSAVL